MKIVLSLLFFGVQAFASESVVYENKDIPVPKGLESGFVNVTMGKKTVQFKSSEYALVKRKQNGPKKTTITRVNVFPNTVKVLAGYGSSGITASPASGGTKLEQGFGFNYGLGYQRDVADHWSVEVIGLGNDNGFNAGLVGVGYKF